MKYAELANAGVLAQPVYEPGKPISQVAREYGLEPEQVAKLASNENPYGPSPMAKAAGQAELEQAHIYPDGSGYLLREAIAAERGVDPDAVILGNGSNEIIELLGHAFLRPGLEVVMGAQAFIVYKLVTRLFGATAVEVPMKNFSHDLTAMREVVTERTRLLFVASPNNPTGAANEAKALLALAEDLPDHVIFCLDEAYAEYLDSAPDMRAAFLAGRKVFCLRTFSKIYGLGGLRVGYGYGDRELVDLLQRVRQPFNVNAVAQAAALAALGDVDFYEMCRSENAAGRAVLVSELNAMGYETFGGSANFVLTRVGDGSACFLALQSQGIIVRPLSVYGMPEYVRITIGTQEENQRLLSAMRTWSESGSITA
ncbi:MAG: histidinol-phosphate transaminase [Verrucomicrobia bacterium]|nr:histidinol-phosphate transaminase [Verrucomicrobiota bacterium]